MELFISMTLVQNKEKKDTNTKYSSTCNLRRKSTLVHHDFHLSLRPRNIKRHLYVFVVVNEDVVSIFVDVPHSKDVVYGFT